MTDRPPPLAAWPRTGAPHDAIESGAAVARVTRTVGGMRVVAYAGRYFAIPERLGALEQIDLSRADALPAGVLVADTEDALVAEVDYVARWANSRGQFDAAEPPAAGETPFRAGSALGEPEISVLESGYTLVRGRGEVYAIRSEDLAELSHAVRHDELAADVTIVSAMSQDALTQMLGIVNDYMVLFLDHMFYAVPCIVLQAAQRDKRLAGIPLHEYPGVVSTSSYPELLRRIGWRPKGRAETVPVAKTQSEPKGATPRLVRTLHDHDVIAYEGWFYGVPRALGPVDLTQTDALSLPGVIADVALAGVENQIEELAAAKGRVP